ncbi:ATP-binding protein [Desulfoluna spongiiphila]|uniref:ATP-binding protein n=1 Tax=Desulfoluna spongiiphila TaxID=419481 RepID=UPI00125A45C3|nr:ATP-binding protein [Desulfoluna spongiiphila]VVS94671.1 helicase hera central domain [Desulfoluna spongiiphila]
MNDQDPVKAEVISVRPETISISVKQIRDLDLAAEKIKVGSFLEIENDDKSSTLAVLKSFSIGTVHEDDKSEKKPLIHTDDKSKSYILEAFPLGVIEDGIFRRGSDALPIPPKGVKIADTEKIKSIYKVDKTKVKSFCFSELLQKREVDVNIDGDRFFGKHFSIIGSTGSGKSNTTAKILQNAISYERTDAENNAHMIIFDIHSEYRTAFPDCNFIDASSLNLPYWLLNSEEMEELFLESGDQNNYNQQSLLRTIITENKRAESSVADKDIFYDSPIKFEIQNILNCLDNLRRETVNSSDSLHSQIDGSPQRFASSAEKIKTLSKEKYEFSAGRRETKTDHGIKSGPFADGSIDKFYTRLHSKVTDKRLEFIFGEDSQNAKFIDVIQEITGYNKKKNISIIDLSGVPFEVLSITVSLISRLLFDFGYFRKKHLKKTDIPLLVVYEEAHKYVPKSDLVKYKSVRNSIERIAKEGRKYGVSLCIVSQRPSEISETIFSQCNNFVVMRLSNPNDQTYVKRLLPENSSELVGSLSTLGPGEALLIGDAIVMPSIVKIKPCSPEPSSSDILYLKEWAKSWMPFEFADLIDIWEKEY